MRIGFDGSRAFIENKTGTENYSYQILKTLLKIDKKNEYIIYVRPGTITDAIVQHNARVVTINWPRLWTQVGLAKQTFQDNLDILFVPAHTSPLIHKRGLKTVVTVHDLGSEYLPRAHQLKQRLYLKWITKYQLKTASKLIAVSNSTKTDLIKKAGIDSKKIEVIYEGFDKNLFKPVKGDVLINSLKEFDLVPLEYFLFVGTIQPRKNLERLIKAFSINSLARSPKTKLIIVGSKGWLYDDIFKLPKKLGIEEKVKFLGRVEDKQLPALYSGAIALIFPSLFEGFGLPIIEAQASGCPVLISNVSSMPEIAGKGALFVNPYSLEDIIRGIREIGEIRGELIKKGFENVKRFSWEKCAVQTLKVFYEVGR